MNNVRNWLLGTTALVIAISILLATFSAAGEADHTTGTTIDALHAP